MYHSSVSCGLPADFGATIAPMPQLFQQAWHNIRGCKDPDLY